MRFVVALVATAVVTSAAGASSTAPIVIDPHDLAGTWTLNTWLTDSGDQIQQELSADLGPRNRFVVDDEQPRPGARDSMGSRRGLDRIRGTGGTASPKPLLNADENKRIQSLIDAAERPAATLTITQTDDGITIADPVRGTRTFATNGARQKQAFDSGTLDSTTRWEGPQLLTDYEARRGVALRFSYMVVPSDNHLLVRISIHMPGDDVAPYVVRHVYDRTGKS